MPIHGMMIMFNHDSPTGDSSPNNVSRIEHTGTEEDRLGPQYGFQPFGGPQQFPPPWDIEKWRREQRERSIALWRSRLKRFGAICSILLFVYLAVALAIMLMMSPEIVDNLEERQDSLFLITPEVVVFATISGQSLMLFFIFLIVTITISYILITSGSAIEISREIFSGARGRHSAILTIGGLFFAMFFLTQIFYLGVTAGGAEPTIPEFDYDLWERIYLFAKASVWEEIISRVLLIGIPLLVVYVFFTLDKEKKRIIDFFLGGKFEFGYVESGLVLFSAAMFAIAHISGWDLWKTVPTFVTGICFGYLFLRIGFHAAVIFHFSFDFLSIPTEFVGESAILIPLGIIILLWLAAGAIFLIYYSHRLGKFIARDFFKFSQVNRQQQIDP